MKGEVLHYDDDAGTGQISGADGIRYSFTRADLKQLVPITKGSKVDFDFEGKAAKDIYLDAPAAPAGPQVGVAPGLAPYNGPIEPDLGLWGYFRRAITSYYANFYGRARRKEFWGFQLFWIILFIVLTVIVAAIAAAMGNSSGSNPNVGVLGTFGIIGLVVYVVAWLALLVPSVAVLVRRVHDIGQSGWVALALYVLTVLLSFVGIGIIPAIIIIVMCCLRGQPGENRYGPPVTAPR